MNKAALIYIIKDNIGGAERRLTRSFDAITDAKVDIIVWDRSSNDKLFREILSYQIYNNANIIRVRNPVSLAFRIFIGRYRWISYFDCSGTIPLIPFIGKISGAKRLWIIASTVFSNLDSATERQKKLFKRFSKYANQIDCLYPSRVSYLQNLFPSIACFSTPVPFTDNRLFYPKEKKNIIAFLGRMIALKHPMEFLEAIYEIVDVLRARNYKVILGGYGPLLDEAKQYILDHNIIDIVETPGYIDSSTILPFAKVFVSLQDFTNYPSQSLIEAISCGCWCIATDVGETNLLVKSNFGDLIELDIESIKLSIINAIEITESADYISKEIEFAQMNFNIMNSVKYYTHIINGES